MTDVAVVWIPDDGFPKTGPKDVPKDIPKDIPKDTADANLAAAIIDAGRPEAAQARADRAGSGIEHLIEAEFDAAGAIGNDGSPLTMMIGHLSPAGRQAFRERLEAFGSVAAAAFRESDLREGMTRRRAGELLWAALTGAQLISEALDETGPPVLERRAMAYKSALALIAPDHLVAQLHEFVDRAAERYARKPAEQPVTTIGQLA